MEIQFLIAEAVQLGGGNLCAIGHDWKSIGGRACPVFEDEIFCSQTVYQCCRCGIFDYGIKGGPGYDDCLRFCERVE